MNQLVNPEVSSLAQIQQINLEPLQRGQKHLRTEYRLKEDQNPILSLPVDLSVSF